MGILRLLMNLPLILARTLWLLVATALLGIVWTLALLKVAIWLMIHGLTALTLKMTKPATPTK